MSRILLSALVSFATSTGFSDDGLIAGNVTPSQSTQQSPTPPKSPDADDDVIIMEEDSDYAEDNPNDPSNQDSADDEYREANPNEGGGSTLPPGTGGQ